jgi:hypothetical protein
LLLDFLGGMSWPLGDDLSVGIGNVGIGLDGQAYLLAVPVPSVRQLEQH